MIYSFKQIAFALIGRRAAYRIGRALYQKARGDGLQDMKSNGEMLLQKCVVDAWKSGRMRGQRLVVFDVGANVGDWSSALRGLLTDSTEREAVDLYVFEPVPETFEVVRKRLGTQIPAPHYEQVALSSGNGEGIIYVSGRNAGTNSLHLDSIGGEKRRIAIIKVTVTDFCESRKIQKIHLLKCDTEGHDMEVVRGASRMLTEERISVLQFEYNHRWISSRNFLKDAFAAAEGVRYKLAKILPHKLLVLDEWHPELERFFHGNYVLVHVDALDWFPTEFASWDRHSVMTVLG